MTVYALIALLFGLHVTISDFTARRVSNIALLVVATAALAGRIAGLPGAPSLASSLAGALIGLLALLPFYAVRWMGAGDVKFFCVLGWLLGIQALLPTWIAASLAAGVHALLVVAWPRLAALLPAGMQQLAGSCPGAAAIQDWRTNLRAARRGRKGIPYAGYMGMAMIGYVLWGYPYA